MRFGFLDRIEFCIISDVIDKIGVTITYSEYFIMFSEYGVLRYSRLLGVVYDILFSSLVMDGG
jgi:hypothetical protein